MQETDKRACASFVENLITLEDLLDKKCKIYSRLLTDMAIAKQMETLAKRHEQRKAQLKRILTGKEKKDEA